MDIINRKKSRRKLRQKEKKYFSRLNGQAKLIYKKYRNNKFSVNENKGKIRKLTKEYITEPSFMIQLPKKFSIYDQSNCRSVIRVCNLITKKHKL